MKKREEIEEMVLEMPVVYKDYPFGENVAVYKVRSKDRKIERKYRQDVRDH